MDSSFLQTQHPVVEELLTNKYFGDTLLVCANGHLTDNKLAVGLLFPALLTSDIFALPIENVLLVPDYTMEEIGREFEKLIIGKSYPPIPIPQYSSVESPPPEPEVVENIDDSDTDLVIDESSADPEETTIANANEINFHSHEIEVSGPTSMHVYDIENGFDVNCHNIEIGESTNDSIEIYVQDSNGNQSEMCNEESVNNFGLFSDIPSINCESQPIVVSESNDIFTVPDSEENFDTVPPDITSTNTKGSTNPETVTIVDTDGGIVPVLKPVNSSPDKPKKTVTFSEPVFLSLHDYSPTVKIQRLAKGGDRRKLLRLKVEDEGADTIENLPELVSSPPQSPRRSPKKDSPKKEALVYENRKPGRPRTRNPPPLLRGDTHGSRGAAPMDSRFKQKSAEWKAAERFKCSVCEKVLSCRGSFERHSLMHENSKPFKCDYCPKTFREACKKAVHERVHSGAKPYPCSFPSCGKSFRTATQRSVHMRSHNKEKPFSCTLCGKMFAQPYSKKLHMERFHSPQT